MTSPATRRGWWATLLVVSLLGTRGLAAQGSSSAPALTITAPAAPGGGWDQTARVMQQVLRSSGIATRVQVENIPGAAGTIGLSRFVGADAGRGDALMVTGLVMVSGIVANASPVTLRDVTPIALLTGEYEVIVVPASSPHRDLQSLLDAFRRAPASVSWGGGSAGGTDDLLVRLLAEQVDVDPRRVNYIAFAGGGEALAAVLGSKVTAGVSGIGEFAAQIANGGLRPLAVSAPDRVPGLDAPTFHEAGVNLNLANWRGLVAPPRLSDADRVELAGVAARMAASPEWAAARERNGWSDLYLDPEEFAAFLRAEERRIENIYARIGGAAGVADSQSGGGHYPLLVLLAAVVVGAGLLVSRLRSPERRVPPAVNRAALAWLGAALTADLLLMPTVGFVPAAAVLFLLTARALGSGRIGRDAVVGVVFAALAYLVFSVGLGVTLPAMPLGW